MVNANSISLPQLPAQDDAKSVVVEDKGIARVVTLNRPRVLNCLNHEMGNGRVFCAGGDLRMFFNAKKGGTILFITHISMFSKY
jgi:enoyl-CoA hydratase/carnithine racemase